MRSYSQVQESGCDILGRGRWGGTNQFTILFKSLWTHRFCYSLSTSMIFSCSKLILFPCPKPGICHFSKEPCFLAVQNIVQQSESEQQSCPLLQRCHGFQTFLSVNGARKCTQFFQSCIYADTPNFALNGFLPYLSPFCIAISFFPSQ